MNTKIIIALGLVLLSIAAMAQPGGPPATPIDGGLSLLLAAGGAYGVRKLYKRNKS